MNEKLKAEATRQAILQSIVEKYGEEAAINPNELLTPEEATKYRQQLEDKLKKLHQSSDVEKIDAGGFLLSKDLVRLDNNRTCPVCETYSFESKDDLYMTKFECCFKCYVKYVEHREERWKSGWRPNLENKKNKID
jgi:hypothetical protein